MHERELFEFLDHTADAAFALTDDGEICSWNTSAESLFGYKRTDVLGKTCFELFGGTGALGAQVCTERCHVRDCAARHEVVADFDLLVSTRAGHRVWVNMSTVVHEDRSSGRRHVVHFARSISARKHSEVLVTRMLQISKELEDVAGGSMRTAPVIALSEQERRVLARLSEGKSPAAVAADLQISAHTLRNHLHHINRKLGTHTRLEAVIHALRRHLI